MSETNSETKIQTHAEIVDIRPNYEVMEIFADVREYSPEVVRVRQSSDFVEIICGVDELKVNETVRTPEQLDNLAQAVYDEGILIITLQIKPHDREQWDICVSETCNQADSDS